VDKAMQKPRKLHEHKMLKMGRLKHVIKGVMVMVDYISWERLKHVIKGVMVMVFYITTIFQWSV
jgi:hypothetical protein